MFRSGRGIKVMKAGGKRRRNSEEPATGPAVVGRRPALEAIRSGSAREVVVAHSARATSGLRDVLSAAADHRVPVTRVAEETIDRLSMGARHQGVVVRTVPLPVLGDTALKSWQWTGDAVVLVLDGVTDPQNVGAAARTAEASGADAMIVRKNRGAATTAAAVKASAGALMHLPVVTVTNIARTLRALKEAEFWVVGLEVGGSGTLEEAEPPPGRLALVVGSEGEGLSRLVRETCDELVAIPLRGKTASLNVAVAAGVGLFTYANRRNGVGGK
jgi:23S rRNA (guanosine2251-2'-O)-methyltransferase